MTFVSRRLNVATILAIVLCANNGCDEFSPSPYFPNISPARVIDFSPIENAVGIDLNPVLQLEFSRDLDPASGETVTVSMVSSDDNVIAPISASYGLRLLRIQPDQALEQGTSDTVEISGLMDKKGAPLDASYEEEGINPIQWTFSTLTDATGPSDNQRIPASSQTEIPPNQHFTVLFDEPLGVASFRDDWLILIDTSEEKLIVGSLRYDALAQALIFLPDTDLPENTSIRAVLSGGIVDPWGNTLVGGTTSWEIGTGSQRDTEAPTPGTSNPPTGIYNESTQAIDINWELASDTITTNAADLRYEVWAKGGSFPEVGQLVSVTYKEETSASFKDLEYGDYTFQVFVVDGSGNRTENCTGGTECPVQISSKLNPVYFTEKGATPEAEGINNFVRSIFTNRCALPACHTETGGPGFIDLSVNATYNDIITAGSWVMPVSEVDPAAMLLIDKLNGSEGSYLYWKIADNVRLLQGNLPFPYKGGPMPPPQVQSLSYFEIDLIRRWIEQGAREMEAP